MTPPPPATPEKKGWSTWSTGTKVLVILAGLVVAAVGSFVLFMVGAGVWLFLPGEQVPAGVAFAGDDTGRIAFRSDIDDPGVKALVETLGEALDEMSAKEDAQKLPEQLRFLAGAQRRDGASGVRMIWPKDLAFAYGPDDRWRGAANFRRFGGAVRLLMMFADSFVEHARTTERSGHEIVSGVGYSIANHGSTVLFGSGEIEVIGLVDRALEDAPGPAPSPELDALAKGLDPRHELVATFTGSGPLETFLQRPAAPASDAPEVTEDAEEAEAPDEAEEDLEADAEDEEAIGEEGDEEDDEAERPAAAALVPPEAGPNPALASVRGVAFGVDVTSDDRFEFELELTCGDACEPPHAWLVDRVGALEKHLESDGVLAVDWTSKLGAQTTRIEGRVDGIRALIFRTFADLE